MASSQQIVSAAFHQWIMPLYELIEAARTRLKKPGQQRLNRSHTLIGIRAWHVHQDETAKPNRYARAEVPRAPYASAIAQSLASGQRSPVQANPVQTFEFDDPLEADFEHSICISVSTMFVRNLLSL